MEKKDIKRRDTDSQLSDNTNLWVKQFSTMFFLLGQNNSKQLYIYICIFFFYSNWVAFLFTSSDRLWVKINIHSLEKNIYVL